MPTQELKHKKWQEIAEEVVWGAFKAGDHDALEYIYYRHVRDLYNYGHQVIPNEVLVKEGIQEVFINLWRNRENLSAKVSIKYYLMKALRRQLIKYGNIRKKVQLESLAHSPEDLIWEKDHEHRLIKDECSRKKKQQLHAAISQLPERQREVIYLIFYKGLPYEEAADILSINLSSAYTLVWKALKKLKKLLKHVEVFVLLIVPAGLC